MAMGKYVPEEIKRDPFKFARGAILQVDVNKGRKIIQWHPFRQDEKLRPILSTGDRKAEDLNRISKLSAALTDTTDPRHSLAERVWELAWWSDREGLSITDISKLIMKPKWRYLPLGFKWMRRRLRGHFLT
jgi:hypothetical protein